MHPAHVPLEAEAEAAEIRRPRDAGPRGRLLRRRDDPRLARVDRLVHLLQELDRLEVLAAAELVRQPLAVLARVVEVEHRRDGVDAQPVGVMLLQPVERVREQEVPHLAAAEVEDERAPVGMRAAARIRVLVQRACRRSARAPSRRAGSARAPSRGSRRCPFRAAGRRSMRKSSGVPKRDVGAK